MAKHFFWLFCFILLSCAKDKELAEKTPAMLSGMPKEIPEMNSPSDNTYTKERWDLGKKLFYDNVLSRTNTINCGSCHHAALAFSDHTAVSVGVENRLGTRNSPSLANIGYHPYFTREGGVPTLEMQVFVPLQEHDEFDFNIVLAAERLQADSNYVKMSLAAYNRKPDAFVITRALACFERTFISTESTFDQYWFKGATAALNEEEKAGMELFFSERTNCSKCHNGFNFTNYSFQNNGLYENYTDPGRFRLTRKEEDRALFKVPSLRNIALTRPYMHNGALGSLKEVIEHYNTGGKNHPNKSALIKPLGLSDLEKNQLVQFLNTLTDYNFIANPKFKN